MVRRTLQGSSRRVRLTAVALLATVLSVVAITATAGATPDRGVRARATATRQVAGLLTALRRATFIRDAAATQTMSIGVGVNPPHPSAEHAFYDSLNDPSSPDYHHFLTVRQFDSRFGVSTATLDRVRTFLTSTGATVSSVSSSGTYLTLRGTVAQIDSLFDVTIGDYRYAKRSFFANDRPASVPADLPISGTLGLNSYDEMTLDSLSGHQLAAAEKSERAAIAAGRRVIARNAALTRAAADRDAGGAGWSRATSRPAVTAQAGSEMVFTPQDLWGMYDDPGAGALTNANGTSTPATLEGSNVALGQGQTIGVFGAGEMSSIIPQLRLFEAAEGLPKVPVRTIETEGGPDSAYDGFTGDAVEWYLDTQSSTGMAPDVKQLDLYFAKNFLDADVESLFSDWANDPNGPREMNASFGECEGNPLNPVTQPTATLPVGAAYGYSLETQTEATLEQAAIEGRTLFTSAGDTGSGCPEIAAPIVGAGNGLVIQPVPEVGYPCASEYAVCVGGTVLSSKGTSYPASAQRDAETSWTYGGGGTSLFIPKPSFQDGVTAINTNCISQPDGTPYAATTPCRGVPDVADLSGNVDGDAYFIYIDGSPSSEGGTSLSSPLMMGQWARIQSAAPAATQSHGGLGFADPIIYRVAKGADGCNTGDLDSAESAAGHATPCSDATYDKDFYDITESEDAGDATGVEGAGALIQPITGFNNLNTGVGTSNGAYFPAPGWDYDTGWGALNVANFMQTVDGGTTATDGYTGAEDGALDLSTVTLNGVPDSATDPASGEDDPGLNLTGATLSATTKTVTATLTAPQLSSGPPADATGGDAFYVDWLDNGTVYFATALESPSGSWSYASGNTKTGFPENTENSAATGSVDTSTGQITIAVPASEVGSPAQCSLLSVPQALDVAEEGSSSAVEDSVLGTIDSADNYRGYSVDGGESDSIGASVVVGGSSACGYAPEGFPAVSATTPNPAGSGQSPTHASGAVVGCSLVKLPTTHITHKSFSSRRIRLSGTAAAHCPDRIVGVGVAIARAVKVHHGRRTATECEFLTARHRWTRAGSCRPRDYLKATGTRTWSFGLRLKLTHGIYHVWERAEDNRRQLTHNTAAKYVWFTIR